MIILLATYLLFVEEIRASNLKQWKLAERYLVNQSTISRIRSGARWQ